MPFPHDGVRPVPLGLAARSPRSAYPRSGLDACPSLTAGIPRPPPASYAESFVAEDECWPPPGPGPRRWAARRSAPAAAPRCASWPRVIDARAVVEVGTGTGVSGLWLLRGMRSDGVLTTVDIEAEHQRLARETFTEGGIAARSAPGSSPARRSRCSPG